MHAAIHSLYEKKLCLKNSFSHTFYGLFLIFSLPYLYFYAITTSSQFYRQSIGPSLSLNDLILKLQFQIDEVAEQSKISGIKIQCKYISYYDF